MRTTSSAKSFRRGGRPFIPTAALLLALLLIPSLSGPAFSAAPGEAPVSIASPDAAAAQATAAAVPPTLSDRFGTAQSHLIWIDSIFPDLLEQNLDAMVDAGIGWVRCVFAWPDLETSEGVWDFTHADRAVAKAGDRGIKILGIMIASPGWANGGQPWNYPPTDHAAWTNYASILSGRYQGEVAAWEIWNEEDIHAFWQPAPDSAAYMPLLREASGAIRSADPGATIVMGGVAGLDPDYLNACLDAGAADYVDALAYHPYPETLSTIPPDTDYSPKEALTRGLVEWVRSLIAEHTTKPLQIWLTEFGWTTCTLVPPGVSEDNQAAYLLRSLLNYAGSTADKVFYYDLWEEVEDTADPGYCYGLLHHDFTAKPAYHYYQRFEEVFGPATTPSSAPLTYQCATPGTLETRAYQHDAGTLAVAAWKTDGLGDSLNVTLDSVPRWYLDPVRVDLMTGARTAVPGVTRNADGDITVTGLAVGNTPVILEFAVAPPILDSIVPPSGRSGETVTLTGDRFGAVQEGGRVYFASVPATQYASWSDGSIQCSIPALSPGPLQVTVVTPGGTSDTLAFSVTRPVVSTWCLAEGSTAGDMETWVLVQNPGTAAVSVDLTLQTGEGALAPAALQNVNIPGASRVSFRLNDYCQTYDVSTLVSASGPVVAERATYGPGREWAHDSVGVSAPAATWCLAEGSTAGDMETWVLVQNPGTCCGQRGPHPADRGRGAGSGCVTECKYSRRLARLLPLERLLPDLRRLHPGFRLGAGGGGAGHLRAGAGVGPRLGRGERTGRYLVPGGRIDRRRHGDLGAGAEPGDGRGQRGPHPADRGRGAGSGCVTECKYSRRLARLLPLERLLPDLRRLHPGFRLGAGGGGAGHLRAGAGVGPRLGRGERTGRYLVPGGRIDRRRHGDLGAGAEPGDGRGQRGPHPADRGRGAGSGCVTECKYSRRLARLLPLERLLPDLRRLHPGFRLGAGGGGAGHLRAGAGVGPRLGRGGAEIANSFWGQAPKGVKRVLEFKEEKGVSLNARPR